MDGGISVNEKGLPECPFRLGFRKKPVEREKTALAG
jgi:hypothetical protein